jgi:hypothetical protein
MHFLPVPDSPEVGHTKGGATLPPDEKAQAAFMFELLKYLALTASTYSLTANLVIVASNFGNTSVEATIPASVTVIMSQFAGLTSSEKCDSLRVQIWHPGG